MVGFWIEPVIIHVVKIENVHCGHKTVKLWIATYTIAGHI